MFKVTIKWEDNKGFKDIDENGYGISTSEYDTYEQARARAICRGIKRDGRGGMGGIISYFNRYRGNY